MKYYFAIFVITLFLMYNTYHEGKYTKMLLSGKKYYQIALIAFIGLSLCVFMKKHPNESKSMMYHANDIIKYLPIQKGTADLLTPFMAYSKTSDMASNNFDTQRLSPQYQRMMKSGNKSTGRSVSETKKKFVASRQNWMCDSCKKQLPAWFEVDHKTRLADGGSNHIDNLVALCRDCHGMKTTVENL